MRTRRPPLSGRPRRARVWAQHQIAVLEEQLRQSRLGVDQARADAEGRVNEAEGRLAAAEAQLTQAQATHAQAQWDREAMARLFQKGLVAEQEAQRAQNNEEAQAAIVAAQRRQVEAARGALTAAKANLVNPAIRSSQVVAVEGQILQAQADIAAAQAEAARARAQLEEARANRTDLRVIAPFNGTVATRTAEPGEVVMAGHGRHHAREPGRGLSASVRSRGADRARQRGPAGTRLPRLGAGEAHRRLCVAGRSAGVVHAREHPTSVRIA